MADHAQMHNAGQGIKNYMELLSCLQEEQGF